MPLISTPIPAVSKPTSAIQPPKKVIRALDDHRPPHPLNELSFSKGDFFYVINEIDQGPGWYEANNPMTGARGLVPRSKFEVFNKSNAALQMAQAAGRSPFPKSPGLTSPPPTSPRPPVFHAIVQHDFLAERADELDAKAGDHISVVAQSNFEWFVAKPISRLGRPGLIPVSFVAVSDPATGRAMTESEVTSLMESGEVPGVEDWKKSILEYKATSISLGTLDDDFTRGSVANSPYVPPQPQQTKPLETIPEPEPEPQRTKTPVLPLSRGIILSGEVLSWHFEMDEYWFRIHALFQPDGDPGSNRLPPAKQLLLFRAYNDFYDLQVNLLEKFPLEAGRVASGSGEEPKRILPYMPGPSQHVDDKVTQLRKDELDQYLFQLCALWEVGGEHVLRSRLVLDFFTPRTGDNEEDVEPAYRILEERAPAQRYATGQEDIDQMKESFLRMNMQESGNRYSDGSNYDERGYASSSKGVNGMASRRRSGTTSPTSERMRYRQNDQQDTAYPRDYSPYPTNHKYTGSSASALSRSTSTRRNEYEEPVAINGLGNIEASSPQSYASGQAQPLSAAPSTGSAVSRARSGSNALNSPPISANNPNTAFIKIKIFDRLTQDLIAIRVSPRVTHDQLMDKVRLRLGDDVHHLAYRNSISNTFVGLNDDVSLKEWLEGTDKHTLYAD
ncbi:uncharacterized protein FOMMEDRAFT_89426 [Fomitiporia mediterranea MF3/22]|uniref:uncharacterized protein n=1 Tax=Fomitiporia mediterranea (strain MF3/22) TaxID=694068 RepID=UPI00044079A8|nr:uncharacterized protein FOMMEDRAFT_89426 [Fomitiporia mediterranea MF3/22]EJD01301.1 hypothetical protein FOMMEDRAFT_89426 [Fomitiporia mediterranea MF3/22]